MTRTRIVAGLLLGLLVAGLALAPVYLKPTLSDWVRTQLSAQLERAFDANLVTDSFDVSVFPSVSVTSSGMKLYKRDRPDSAPIISISKFSASTSLTRLWNGNIKSVTVDGLTIAIPPGMRPSLKPTTPSTETPPGPATSPAPRRLPPLVIDEIVSTGARLVILPNNPAGVPLVFDISMARLEAFSTTEPARFEARLMNPRPRGEIAANGMIGPWQSSDPRKTRVDGTYALTKADMSVFRGIGGFLDSIGRFSGTLDSLAVDGAAEVPDFSVETGKHPMPLKTTFVARVDGTNGNTYLDRVSAVLGNSPIEAAGEIAAAPGQRGKTIRLSVKTQSARLEDLINLVVMEQPAPMRGRLHLDAKMELPPGDEPVIEALKLSGHFTIRAGSFASDAVQDKVDELSRKGRGQPKDTSIDNVLSEFSGQFALQDGLLQLPRLQFAVRGAQVRLAGSYGLRGERLGFTGELRLQARISQTTTGFKSILLKVVDPFFRKHGAGAVLPIRVAGTVAAPEFGLNLFGGKKR